jgi:hypothetical protein
LFLVEGYFIIKWIFKMCKNKTFYKDRLFQDNMSKKILFESDFN